MTTATVAPVSGNVVAVFFAVTLVIAFIYGAILWQREGVMDGHDDELGEHTDEIRWLKYQMAALLKDLGREIPEPIEDDSPAALQQSSNAADDDTDRFPAIPATEPSGIPIQVHGALIEARDLSGEFPHPVDSADAKAKTAAWVEAEVAKIRARIEAAQGAS